MIKSHIKKNNVYCEICNVYVHKNSLWKHRKSNKHINNQR